MCYTDRMTKQGELSWRRTETQILSDQESATILALQGYTHRQIAAQISEKRGYKVSRDMVSDDLARAKGMMADRFYERAEMAIAMEMKRLDVLESIAWKKFRELGNDGTLTEEVMEITGEREEEMTRTVTQKNSSVELGWFNKVLEVQKERRRILNMYAPSHITLINTQKNEVKAKAYIGWSPDEWKARALEGEIVS